MATALIEYLDQIFSLLKKEKDFILYHFFKGFWIKRILANQSEFEGYQHLQKKGVQTINEGQGKNLNRLFRVLSNHINDVKLNQNQQDWLDCSN